MLVTLLGIVTDDKDQQTEKTLLSMLVTLLGMITEDKDSQ